jgi:outer membrane translocation and assembly module TamA
VTESVLGTADGPIDCSTAPNRCVLAAANAPIGQDYASAPLSFDPPELTVQGVGVTEGTGGMTMAPVRVMLSKPDRNPITVHWMAEPGTATQGTDFTSMRGTLTIPAGATEAMIDASVVADAIDEPTETFTVRVVDALGTRVTDRVGTVTIHDDDAAPAATVHDTRRREDHGEAQAEVTLSAPSGKTVIVHYVTHHLTARAGSDYVRKDGRLVFLPGETRHLVRVVLVDDAVHEATETFSVVLDEVEQATIARGAATVTVTDDD